MALAAVLSAVRELMLDAPDLPAEEDERAARFRTMFPELSEPELEDLARINPTQLRIYTSTIFGGERKVLQNHYPITLALLERHWKEAYRKDFNVAGIARSMHKTFPWKSKASIDLVQNFRRYLLESCDTLIALCPLLESISLLELRTLEIRRAEDKPLEAHSSLSMETLREHTVESLMNIPVCVPECARFETFTHAAPAIYRGFHTRSGALPESYKESPCCAVGSRNARLLVRWEPLAERAFKTLSEQQRETPFLLAELAELFVESYSEDTEEQLFARFLADLTRLVASGAIVIPSP